MLLTKKSLWKIWLVAILYFVLGSACIGLAIVSSLLQIETKILYLGIAVYAFCPLIVLWGRYAEGKGKLINLGRKLVRLELNPAEFIKRYEALKNSADLVLYEPCLEVLQFVAAAYDLLGNREAALSTVEEMVAASSKKRKTFAKLFKASVLFDYGMTDEAEALFSEARGEKQDLACQALTDAILKGDRAMAMGDYQTVVFHKLKLLEQSFPKLDPLGKLVVHHGLAKAYEKLGDTEKARLHYRYCVENGGDTDVRISAQAAIERLS